MSDPLGVARSALSGRAAWLVGGAVRDRLLERSTRDLDIVIEGDPEAAAVAISRAARAARFALSEEFGAWRVSARDGSWQIDLAEIQGGSLRADLLERDFTVNAIAEPLAGGALVDPLDGAGDLRQGRLRMVSPEAFSADPLRVLRLTRLAVELGLEPAPETIRAARERAAGLAGVSAERIFMELRRILAADEAPRGLQLLSDTGASTTVLPELEALRGVRQSRFHHLDVYGHTVEVLEQTISLQAEPAQSVGGSYAREVQELLAESLADGLTRGDALRWGALLHDVAKPLTREVRAHDGRVTFIGHDQSGAELAREILTRLRASERLRAHVAALTRHHLRLGFLVHAPQPLAPEVVFDYLRACEPVEVDVTLLSVADRLATRGDRAQEAIDAHMRVVAQLLGAALRWRAAGGAPKPLWRGDDLADALAIELGPGIGELLEQMVRAQYCGLVTTREEALAFARGRLANSAGLGASE